MMRCERTFQIKNQKAITNPLAEKYFDVPCGRCYACRVNYINSWNFRLLVEGRTNSPSFFITLTYEDQFIRFAENLEPTTYKRDIQLLWKNLRKKTNDKFKYYAVSEYGERTGRPHFHVLIFGLKEVDLIRQLWKYGFVHIGRVTHESIRYTLGYMKKKAYDYEEKTRELKSDHKKEDRINLRDLVVNDDPMFYSIEELTDIKEIKLGKVNTELKEREKEKSYVSNGIGDGYLIDKNINYHLNNMIDFVKLPGGSVISLPRYYRDRIFNDKEKDYLNKLKMEYFMENEEFKEDKWKKYMNRQRIFYHNMKNQKKVL